MIFQKRHDWLIIVESSKTMNQQTVNKSFDPFCVECQHVRLPSSSNAKFHFDYCTNCKKVTNFTGESSNAQQKEKEDQKSEKQE